MKSVPSRGSGWVSYISNRRLVSNETAIRHLAIRNWQCTDPPATAGGTDFIAWLAYKLKLARTSSAVGQTFLLSELREKDVSSRE